MAGDHHVTADEIVARVTERDGGNDAEAHRATVYRTLDRLQELGVVRHVHLGHGPSTYHLDGGDAEPHHHAVCSSCGAVVEVPLDALDDLAERLRESHGFVLAPQHFALTAVRPASRPDRPLRVRRACRPRNRQGSRLMASAPPR